MTPHKVLFIGHLWPEPTSSAAGYRTLALLKAIVNDKNEQGETFWQLHFACAADKTEFCANLDAWQIISHPISLNDSSFDRFICDLQPELVFYDRFITEEQFAPRVYEQCPEAINILDTQDLHFLRRARQNAFKNKQSLDLYSDDSIREIATILRCDLTLIISDHELQLLIEQFKIAPELLHYCPFMLNLDENAQQHNTPREHFVMMGNFLHPPNWDAVLWCCQSIWPLIRKKLPHAQLHVYGAYPSEKVWQLHQPEKGFFIKGRADDAIDTFKQYRVNLAPLRFGAGIKGKVADGFIAGTPCVTTTIGYEGMALKNNASHPNWGGLVCENNNDAREIAHLALELYQNTSLWQQCVMQGKQVIQYLFNEQQHTEALQTKLKQLYHHLAEHRKANFYGKILRHNLYRSQYFMSKWIEEKNKDQ